MIPGTVSYVDFFTVCQVNEKIILIMNYCDRLEMGDMVYTFVGETRHTHETTPQQSHNLKFIILVTFLRAIESSQKPLQGSN